VKGAATYVYLAAVCWLTDYPVSDQVPLLRLALSLPGPRPLPLVSSCQHYRDHLLPTWTTHLTSFFTCLSLCQYLGLAWASVFKE
jgi:hypothetical protein